MIDAIDHPRAAGFVRAICENPGDDAVRVIFADWLEENGEPERAKIIRTQIAAEWYPAGIPKGGPSLEDLRRSERELLEAHGTEWLAGFLGQRWVSANEADGTWFTTAEEKPIDADVAFRRGFVEFVTCTTDDWITHGPAIVACQPVMRVVLVDKKPRDEFRQWWPESPTYQGDHAWVLPNGIYLCLPQKYCVGDDWERHKHTAVCYSARDEKAALDALSLAAVNFARRAAGLSDLPAAKE